MKRLRPTPNYQLPTPKVLGVALALALSVSACAVRRRVHTADGRALDAEEC